MKYHHLILSLFFAPILLSAQTPVLRNAVDSLSWVMGRSYAEQYRSLPLRFNDTVVLQAFTSTLLGLSQPIDSATYSDMLDFLQFNIFRQQQAMQQRQAADVQQREQEYLSRLRQQDPTILTSPDGYCYQCLRPGNGRRPYVDGRVSFHFRSLNMFTGDTIDCTFGRRDPVTTVLNEHIIPALLSGLQLMDQGSLYRFYFPNALAYGAEGKFNLPPFTPLIYEVELLQILDD